MRTKPTLHDIICLHLADIGDWVPSYSLSKTQTRFGWVGSSGERRARELAEAGEHFVKGMVYTIERRKVGKYAEYRVAAVAKKRPKFAYIERDGVMVEVLINSPSTSSAPQ
jgi:hypothetical protein